jgi:hypothetical protein
MADGGPGVRVARREEPQRLSEGGGDANAHSVHVSGGDVYVAGSEGNAQGNSVATLRKNFEPQPLSDGNDNEYVQSAFVFGKDVYVVKHGFKITADKVECFGFICKNGFAQRLGDGKSKVAVQSVFVK